MFTHLDEKYQHAWLGELQRITRPGAILIRTVHGEPIISRELLASALRRELDEKGFRYVTGTTGKLNLNGLPDFYQTAYHKNEYIRRVRGRYFEVIRHVPEVVNCNQDAVVLRRR